METYLETICNGIRTSERKDTAKELYSFFRTVTPQFYKGQTETEIKQSIASIQILTSSIPSDMLAELCRIEVQEYPKQKSRNPNCFFNLDYLLMFRDKAKESLRPKWANFVLAFDTQTRVTTYGDKQYLDDNWEYPDDAPRYYEED